MLAAATRDDDHHLRSPSASSSGLAASPCSSAASVGGGGGSESTSPPQQQKEQTKALGSLFIQGQQIVEKIDDLDSSSSAFNEALQTGLKNFQEVATMLGSLSLISKNEELDDVATIDLKYVLVDYYLGILHEKVPGRGEDRRQSLERAKRYFISFMTQCERLRLLQGDDLRAWEEETCQEEAEEEEEEDAGRGGGGGAAAGGGISSSSNRRRRGNDPATLRATKIERFRREKAAKERLRELNYLLAKLGKESGGNDGDDDELGEREEVERERLKLWIETCIRKVLDEWSMIKQELEILEMMRSREGGGAAAAAGRGGSAEDDQRPPPPRQPLNVTHVDSIGGQLRIRQETLRAQVFRPGYSQPTMSLEEYAAIEMAQAKEAEEKAKNAPKLPRRYNQLVADGDEDDEGFVEEATYQDRAWDNFKDDHPFGSGNKMGKRF